VVPVTLHFRSIEEKKEGQKDMRSTSDILHTLVAIALTAPILVFYAVIVMDFAGYQQPAERFAYVSPSALSQICTALARGKL
jgi:uncharacterized membrane protein